jgi:hypothetical protein
LEHELPQSQALLSARAFWQGLEEESRLLFGDDTLAERLTHIARQLRHECEQLAQRAGGVTPAIAILGKTGEGKSWLARCFLTNASSNEPVLAAIRSGQNDVDRTQRLLWFGPTAPAELGEGEQHLHVDAKQMLDLGRPYIVGDTPGFSNYGEAASQLARLAVRSAAIKLVVIQEETLRDGDVTQLFAQMDGALVLPVIRFRAGKGVANPVAGSVQEVERHLAMWRAAAPHARVLSPCYLPDQDLFSTNAKDTRQLVQQRLRDVLTPALQDEQVLRTAVENQIAASRKAAEQQAATVLHEFSQRVGPCVRGLDAIQRDLPGRLIDELLGTDLQLRAGIRRQLRAMWMDFTPSWCFPYRTFTGLLVLTAGAWDRLVFSLAGSLPSLALTAFQSIKNVKESVASDQQIREGISLRLERIARQELIAEVDRFKTALDAMTNTAPQDIGSGKNDQQIAVRISGLDQLESQCREMVQASIERYGPRRFTPFLFGFVATVVFAALLAGPVVTLYRDYLPTAWQALNSPQSTTSWRDFPVPSVSMLLASLCFSAAPVFLLSLVALGWGCRTSRVNRIIKAIRHQLDAAKHKWSSNAGLKVDVDDARIDAARKLINRATIAPTKNPSS